MGGVQEEGLNDRDFAAERDRIISACLNSKYHARTQNFVKRYHQLLLQNNKRAAKASAQDIFKETSNAIRNSMNHLGYASAARNLSQASYQIQMAEWHLNIANARALVPAVVLMRNMIRDTVSYLRIVNAVRKTFRLASEDDVVIDVGSIKKLDSLYDAFIMQRRRIIPGLKRTSPAFPSTQERETLEAAVNVLAEILTDYMTIYAKIWDDRATLENKSALSIREIRARLIGLRLGIAGPAGLFILIKALLIGAGGNLTYELLKLIFRP
jgi:hypothetical protein